jgi:nucleotide-binding universal stress UspA family protein
MALTTIVAGCDLSTSSDHALERAIGLAQRHRARLVLVHAQASEAPGTGPEADNVILEQLDEVASAIRDELAQRLASKLAEIRPLGLSTSAVSRIGAPDEVLAQVADQESAELIVVGTQGHTGISRFLLGSVAAATVRRSHCDVLVVRGDPVRGAFSRPLVATDFSPAAAKALAHTDDFLVAPGGQIDVVHAWQMPTGSWGASLLGENRFPWSTVRDAVLASAKPQAERLSAEHGGLRVELVQGPAAHVITETAERGRHDLVVVGAHGHRGFRRLLLGSVAESTVRHAVCSVLVVHGAA